MQVGDQCVTVFLKLWNPKMPPFGRGIQDICRKVKVEREVGNNSQRLLQDIMEKVQIAELTLDRKSEDCGWEGSHEEEEHVIRGKNT